MTPALRNNYGTQYYWDGYSTSTQLTGRIQSNLSYSIAYTVTTGTIWQTTVPGSGAWRRGYAKDTTTPRAKATVRALQQPLELSILPTPALMFDTSMKVVRWNRRCFGASRPRASHRRRQRPEGWIGR